MAIQQNNQNMKRMVMTIMVGIALIHIVSAGQMLSYTAMPSGIGHATDVKGVRYPNAICVKDVVESVLPLYPYYANVGCAARDVQGSGMFRLSIHVNSGRVRQVTIIKSMGDRGLDAASI